MSHEVLDTDTLLAILSSTLDSEQAYEQSELLEALASHNGDVSLAAHSLRLSRHAGRRSSGEKRKWTGRMDDWLVSSQTTIGEKEASTARKIRVPPSRFRTASNSMPTSKEATDFMPELRTPSVSTRPNFIKRRPHLTLSSPAMVIEHIPCTLHTSALPPELACRLYHIMLDKSKGWVKDKWYMFGRLVETRHRAGFFARRTNGIDNDEDWFRKARLWFVKFPLWFYHP
jgi:hypothetical protein